MCISMREIDTWKPVIVMTILNICRAQKRPNRKSNGRLGCFAIPGRLTLSHAFKQGGVKNRHFELGPQPPVDIAGHFRARIDNHRTKYGNASHNLSMH